MLKSTQYPKPGPVGGSLIRKVISFLKEQGCHLPLSSHILIATSGGSDSMALAHMMVHIGRRIVNRNQITLLHVNHGWRGLDSDGDEHWVREAGARWGIPVEVFKLDPPQEKSKGSWEEKARTERKKIFNALAEQMNAQVFTAHHADDLAETLLWRIFTGAAQTHGGGIAFRHERELRPFLGLRKVELQGYLAEVGESYREDATNHSDRFLRARMRSGLMKEVETLFPKAVEHLGNLARVAQQEREEGKNPIEPFEALIKAAGIRARRPHLALIMEKLVANKPWYGEIHLPGGWRLLRERTKGKLNATLKGKESFTDRWILERSSGAEF